jgi:hypothetical protein
VSQEDDLFGNTSQVLITSQGTWERVHFRLKGNDCAIEGHALCRVSDWSDDEHGMAFALPETDTLHFEGIRNLEHADEACMILRDQENSRWYTMLFKYDLVQP